MNPPTFLILLLILTGSAIAQAKGYYVHTDHLGAPVAMTDENQNVVWKAEYKPFGKATVNDDPDEDGETVTLNIRFPGQYYDQETRLHYNYYRYYDPQLGRYITSDPIGLEGGMNTYIYALANPTRYIDPLGLWVKLCARKLGDKDQPAVKPSGDLRRHDYLVISNQIRSFQRGGDGWTDMLWSQGRVDRDEHPDNPECMMVCEDDRFDKYVLEAANNAPKYCVIPGMPGARNCQTWAREVLRKAKKEYIKNEDCPECFSGGSGNGGGGAW